MKSLFMSALMAVCLAILPGCNQSSVVGTLPNDDPDALMSGDVEGLNYTPYYVHTFNIAGHDNGIGGGGPNIVPVRPDYIPTESGGACCGTFPVRWRPGLKVTVRWIANKKLDGHAWGSWYKAEAEIPEYGTTTYGMWVIFLPGDRVKVMVMDGNANGYNRVRARPADDDPYVAVGRVDDEANREEEAARLVRFGEVIKADPSIGGLK
ncbi:DUF3304 domain-containing protein [Cupriavidus necator]|uniref:DUF3304 domain-containing protein n=1 Tax=Cupriavidus necator (strain ATCC 17699 / DSM 428 / KCTC 22496 / NCIMB 10442 / H16 / Stanier 337) TaxID=381666 RepID=Q0K9K1_CUPNH|nr:DUF3304 domain-containing protein [Cupriavidus necator]QQB76047.1 DUF3304 domain-containing protein [Cupriavidus necator]WKA39508.1 DUF3304 domain-containing protein [Cupriavidus necator]CAJ93320.1 Hypothetical protein H16_A2223 [Cupriavidus necator H16]